MSKFPREPSKTGSKQRGSWPSVAQLLLPEPDLFSLRALLADLIDQFSLWGNFSDVHSLVLCRMAWEPILPAIHVKHWGFPTLPLSKGRESVLRSPEFSSSQLSLDSKLSFPELPGSANAVQRLLICGRAPLGAIARKSCLQVAVYVQRAKQARIRRL